MTQPGVYWLLDAPFLRIIGLYSNKLENPGFLQGKRDNGDADTAQLDWLKATLTKIAKNKTKKALLIATHHPPFSQSGHSGSTDMLQSIETTSCKSTGDFSRNAFVLWPTRTTISATPAGSVESKSRIMYTWQWRHFLLAAYRPATGQPADQSNQTTYDAALQVMGYLFVTVSANTVQSKFWQKGQEHTDPFDALTVSTLTTIC